VQGDATAEEVLAMERRNLRGVGLIVVVIVYVFQIIYLWPILVQLSDIVPLLLVHISALIYAAGVCMKLRRNEAAVAPGEVFFLTVVMVATWVLDLGVLRQFVNR